MCKKITKLIWKIKKNIVKYNRKGIGGNNNEKTKKNCINASINAYN